MKCPECGTELTQEMIDANLCWECGKILDESLLYDEDNENFNESNISTNEIVHSNTKTQMLTTGFNFDGYTISKYNGLVSGEVVLGTSYFADIKAGISDFFGTQSLAYSAKLKKAKKVALQEMLEESNRMNGNAIIGISYSISTLAVNMISVSVNGTCVLIEKIN